MQERLLNSKKRDVTSMKIFLDNRKDIRAEYEKVPENAVRISTPTSRKSHACIPTGSSYYMDRHVPSSLSSPNTNALIDDGRMSVLLLSGQPGTHAAFNGNQEPLPRHSP
jgi:hypothetical protein